MPYIELRHRAPENRLRLPFPVPPTPEQQQVTAQSAAVQPGLVRTGETGLGQLDQHHLGALPGSDPIEEHLDSAVKDLEDVEVKDLVDLNLNLDPEDGMSPEPEPVPCVLYAFYRTSVCVVLL